MSRRGDSGRGAARLKMVFDDNSLLPALFGEHDRHLARIEQRLDVSIVSRGNRLEISGPREEAEGARAALSQLYEMLKKGMLVEVAEVDAAIRMAGSAEGAVTNLAANDLLITTPRRHILPRTPRQAAYVRALRNNDLVFAIGPAGTGKTYLAAATAVSMLLSGRVDRIILSRPAVEAGERLGFLPGDLREKVDPYLRPLYDALYDMLPAEAVEKRLDNGEIEIAPLAFMRGRTLANAFVILDEAQNSTPVQMKMFLTRLGDNAHMAVTGDVTQIDLPPGTQSGLLAAVDVLAGMEGVVFVNFTDADVVRHSLVARIVRAYDRAEAGDDGKNA